MILPGAKVALAALGIVTVGSVAVAAPSIYKHFKDQSNKEEKTGGNTSPDKQTVQQPVDQPQEKQQPSVPTKETPSPQGNSSEGSTEKTSTPVSGDSGTTGS